MRMQQILPIPGRKRRFDHLLSRMRLLPGYCPICCNWTIFYIGSENLRENVRCLRCNSTNRQRQVVLAFLGDALGFNGKLPFRSLCGLNSVKKSLKVWNTESSGPLQRALERVFGEDVVCSEYFSAAVQSGELVNGIMHVDICATHFQDESLDVIFTGDVLEHVPLLPMALQETYRILKNGGSHVFTVPFFEHRVTTQERSLQDGNGNVVHKLKPWYHDDPIRKDGVLCYRVFAIDLVCKLEEIGFDVRLLNLHSFRHGILGANGYVFVATKNSSPRSQWDPVESYL